MCTPLSSDQVGGERSQGPWEGTDDGKKGETREEDINQKVSCRGVLQKGKLQGWDAGSVDLHGGRLMG